MLAKQMFAQLRTGLMITSTPPAAVASWLSFRNTGREFESHQNPIRIMGLFAAVVFRLTTSCPELGVPWAQWEGQEYTYAAEFHPLYELVFVSYRYLGIHIERKTQLECTY